MRDRLIEGITASGIKQHGRVTKLADKTGYSVGQVSDMLSGKVSLNEKFVKLACTSLGLNYDWVTNGVGEKFIDAPGCVAEPETEYIKMPVRTIGGAGDPCDLQNMEPIRYITLHKDFDGPNIQIVEIRGKSMEPNIMHGALVGIDISDKQIESGEIYACYIPHEGIVVKRIFMAPDTVTIKSDNNNHPDVVVMMERINWETFICGRVSWVLQKYVR